jgi:pimeloyl-ACP methyl ester carboxylesterase
MWSPNVDALSREYRTVAVDQIGEFGRSVCAKPIRTLQDLLAWLDELIVALAGQERVSLIGMSYGGALAAQYALHAPERLDKVVLLAPGATILRPPVEFWLRLLVLAIARRRVLPLDLSRYGAKGSAVDRRDDRGVVVEHAECPAARRPDAAGVERRRMGRSAATHAIPGR